MEGIVLYLLLGSFAGLVAGLLGVGGGLIIVPVLLWVFQGEGFSGHVIMHMAVGTSLATIVFTSLSSVRAHHQHGAVLWPVFRQLAPGIVIGALLGAAIADVMPTRVLQLFFATFEIMVAIQMAINFKPHASRQLPGYIGMTSVGGGIGALSSVVGIGGGTLTVPYLLWCNVTVHKAVATSSACGLPIAVAGCVGFIVMGWQATALPGFSSGYVYWPAFFGIVCTSVLFAPLGARLAHRLPAKHLKRVFAVFLAILGLRMFFS